MDPLIPEISTVIKGNGYASCRIIIVQAGQQSQVDQGLESIADPNDQLSLVHKGQQIPADMIFKL